MVRRLSRILTPLIAGLAFIIAGCGSTSVSLTPADLNTAETDSLQLTANLLGKNFLTDGVGSVTLRSNTDGDTARFYVGATNIAVRFLGINTPESTGKIQPWGKAASEFTKAKLTSAEAIVLINDRDVFGITDSSGNRYLGFVWYKPFNSEKYRLLNLELVEMAYTENLMFDRSSICDYYDAFQRAGAHAEATGARVYGQSDPSFDYSGQVYDISVRFAREAYGETVHLRDRNGELVYDENEDPVMMTLTDSTRIRLRVVVLGTMGNNLIVRDVYDPDDNGHYASIFMFTQYRGAPYQEPGDVVEFYCKVTVFNENVQLTDPELTTYSQKYPYIRITHPEAEDYETALETNGIELEAASPAPVDIRDYTIASSESFAPLNGFYVETDVTIRQVTFDGETPDEGYTVGDYWRKDPNDNMTIYAWFYGTEVSFNLRIDGGMFPYVDYDWFELGHSYTVSGYVAPFYENYQLQLFNGVAITELVG